MNKIGKMLEIILKNKNISIKNVFESVLNGINIFLSAFIKALLYIIVVFIVILIILFVFFV